MQRTLAWMGDAVMVNSLVIAVHDDRNRPDEEEMEDEGRIDGDVHKYLMHRW